MSRWNTSQSQCVHPKGHWQLEVGKLGEREVIAIVLVHGCSPVALLAEYRFCDGPN